MAALLTYGYLIQGLYVTMLAIQSALVPWLIGANSFGLGVYLLSIAVISEGLLEPVWQLSITNRPRGLAVSEVTVMRDSAIVCLLAACAGFWLASEHVSPALALLVALYTVTFYASVVAQSYLYRLQRIREIALSMCGGVAAYCIPLAFLDGPAMLVAANLCFTSATLIGNLIGLRGSGVIPNGTGEASLPSRVRFYLSCLATRAPFVVLNNGLTFVLGAQGLFRDVAIFRLVASAIYAGRFLSPVSPGVFSSMIEAHRLGRGRHPLVVLSWKLMLWIVYGIALVFLLPFVVHAIYPGMVLGAERYVALVAPAYLMMQLLFYWFMLRGRARNRDFAAIVISLCSLLAAGALYVLWGVWIAFAGGCLITTAAIVAVIVFGERILGSEPEAADQQAGSQPADP